MARLPERLPSALSQRLYGASQNIYNRMGREVDIAVAGIPFRLATTSETPRSIETIQVSKEQLDTEIDPGEQTLSGWWRRSQSSFHEGAGYKYEPVSSNAAFNGFWDSEGVDVFTQGELTLLKRMKQLSITGGQVAMGRMRTYAAGGIRVNLCDNPSAETNATNWNGGGSVPPTVTRSTTRAYTGTASIKAVWGAGGFLPQVTMASSPTWSNGVTYTVSCYVYVPTGSPNVQICTPGLGFGGVATAKDQWVRISHTITGDGSPHGFQLWPTTPPDAGDEVYIDAVLFEEGPVVGPYFDGASPNASWAGTAHASTSTEVQPAAAASLTAVGGGALYKSTTDGEPTSALVALHDPTPTLVDGFISGSSFYSVASDGTLYQGLVSAPGSATTWPCGTTPSRMGWGKHRLWVIGGRKIWQPNLGLAGGTTQNPIFTNPNQGWTYTCMAEGQSAMYFGGHDGFSSTIQAITFDSGGGIPSLSGATVTAVLPDGELVQELAVLAGQYLGIGTNRGFRIGVVAQDASITYGPLIVEPEGVTACSAITTQGRYFLVSFRTAGGAALAYRVDTSLELSDFVFPYAKDASCEFIGHMTSLVTIGSQVYGTTSDGRAWYQSETEYVPTGYVESSRIRFRTTEPKAYKFLNLEIEPLDGAIQADLILEGSGTFPVANVTNEGELSTASYPINVYGRYASVRLELVAGSSNLSSPIVNAFLLRALPAVKPARLITLPLLCYDTERARSGHIYGGKGYAMDRLRALQILEDVADTVILQDFAEEVNEGRLVTIESIRFIQSQPAPSHREQTAGGILLLQLRTAEA